MFSALPASLRPPLQAACRANTQGGDCLQALLHDDRLRPAVILLELHPALLRDHGYPGGALGLLELLFALGYTDVSHAG